MEPKISVIIPLFNHEKYVKEAVYSVLEQTFSDFELIIINDGSTDNSEGVVKSIKDDRIKYFCQENQGASHTINVGLQLAEGEYISILNSDDLYHKKRLEECLRILDTDDSVLAVFSHIEFIDSEGNFIRVKRGAEDNWLGRNPETSFRENNEVILDLLAGNFFHTTSNLFCRKIIFGDIGYFSNLKYLHDYEFFLRLCYYHKINVIEKPLLKYRFHGTNALNEDFTSSDFETAVVLANFLINYDLQKILKNIDYKVMTKFFNSINTFNTDKIILTLFLFGTKYGNSVSLFETLTKDVNNPFRKACIEELIRNRDLSLARQALSWQEGQTELWWRKAEELKSEVMHFHEEIRKKDQRIEQLEGTEKNFYEILASNRWKFDSKLNNMIEKLFPSGSRRRLWVRKLLKNL